jgi:hypothetical protein
MTGGSSFSPLVALGRVADEGPPKRGCYHPSPTQVERFSTAPLPSGYRPAGNGYLNAVNVVPSCHLHRRHCLPEKI